MSWFSKLFKVPKNQIEIVRGDLRRDKTIRVIAPKVLPERLGFKIDPHSTSLIEPVEVKEQS